MNKIKAFAIAAAVCAIIEIASAVDSAAQDMDFSFDAEKIAQFMKYIPPIISSVRFYPADPGPDDAVKVVARVGRLKLSDDDFETMDEVKLFYSTDGGETWESADMVEDEDGLEWEGEIPPLGAAGGVAFYVSATDTAGNIARVMSPEDTMPGWEPGGPGSPFDYLDLIFEHEEADPREIPAYMDVRAVWFGYDDDKFYFRVEFKEQPRPGTVAPLDANVYLFALVNRSLVFDPALLQKARAGALEGAMSEAQIMEMAQSVWAWYYAPTIEIAPAIEGVKFPASALIHPGKIDWEESEANKSDYRVQTLKFKEYSAEVFDKGAFGYKINGSKMDIWFDRRLIGPSERDTINFVTGNLRLAGSDIMKAKPLMGDISHSASIVMQDYYYEVE
ncbi:MAG TPA: hypothetical protein PKH33_00420 [bacterium]|nr:hypothetical protein [bacterium]